MLGSKTMEVEILREALSEADPKTDIATDLVAERRLPMKTVARWASSARTLSSG
jgi:hypothetical protein